MACVGFMLGLIFVRSALAISSYQEYMNKSNVLPIGEQSGEDEMFKTEPSCVFPWDCRHVQTCGNTKSGVYRVFPFGTGKGFLAYCDLITDGGGWLVFQRRQDGSVDFYRKWKDYKNGFGNLYGEFWLGLDKIHLLTSQYHTQLMVDLGRFNGESGSAKYGRFHVSDEQEKYRLMVGKYSGNIGDSLEYHNGQQFTTIDSDNDRRSFNCAVRDHGAWWYYYCTRTNLNGEYVYKHRAPKSASSSISWYNWTNSYEPLQFAEMKSDRQKLLPAVPNTPNDVYVPLADDALFEH